MIYDPSTLAVAGPICFAIIFLVSLITMMTGDMTDKGWKIGVGTLLTSLCGFIFTVGLEPVRSATEVAKIEKEKIFEDCQSEFEKNIKYIYKPNGAGEYVKIPLKIGYKTPAEIHEYCLAYTDKYYNVVVKK